MSMREPGAGELNRRIAIMLQSDAPAVTFGLDTSYGTPLTVWAKHEPVGAGIFFGTQQVGEAVTDRFYVRRFTGTTPEEVTVAHVVEFNGQRYRVRRASDLAGAKRITVIETEHLGAA